MPEKTVNIPSIHCEGCASTIKSELMDLEGVEHVMIDVDARKATIRWDHPASWAEIQSVLEDIEFPMQEE